MNIVNELCVCVYIYEFTLFGGQPSGGSIFVEGNLLVLTIKYAI